MSQRTKLKWRLFNWVMRRTGRMNYCPDHKLWWNDLVWEQCPGCAQELGDV